MRGLGWDLWWQKKVKLDIQVGGTHMLQGVARHWWCLLLRGVCAILFGLLAFAWPGITLLWLAILYGVFAITDGAGALMAGFSGREGGSTWWEMVLVGLLGLASGVVAILWPGLTAMVLLVMIAVWAIARGVMEIVAAVKLRKVLQNEWSLVLAGALSILFGIVLLARPAAGALAVVWLIASFAIAFGILSVILALRLRRLHHFAGAPAVP
jgi:uncharacterized membrane protein HdeD (DUF308 family)